jgi:arylsulfatase A
VAASIDLLPTLAKLSDGKLSDRKIDGKDIWPLMSGKPGAKSPHEHYVLMHGPGTVRSGKWKFYPWREGKGGRRDAKRKNLSTEPVQLYDTVADISETKNLAAKHPELTKRLQAVYVAHLANVQKNKRPTQVMKRPKKASSPDRPGQPKKPRKPKKK